MIFLGVERLRILVSGTSGGIGQAFCQRATTHPDWEVIGLVRRPTLSGLAFDAVWSEESMREVLVPIGQVDALVVLHGADIVSAPGRANPYLDRLDWLYQVDIAGTIKLVRATLPQLNPGGTIVLIGSDEAYQGSRGESGELYAVAKAAVMSYGRSLALTINDRARVVIIAPGWVLTRWGQSLSADRRQRLAHRTVSGRWQSPQAVARVIESVLVHPDSAPSGAVISVTGE